MPSIAEIISPGLAKLVDQFFNASTGESRQRCQPASIASCGGETPECGRLSISLGEDETLQPPIEVSVMLQINEFSRLTNVLPVEVVNEALRSWLDTVAPAKLDASGLGPLTPRFDGTATLESKQTNQRTE